MMELSGASTPVRQEGHSLNQPAQSPTSDQAQQPPGQNLGQRHTSSSRFLLSEFLNSCPPIQGLDNLETRHSMPALCVDESLGTGRIAFARTTRDNTPLEAEIPFSKELRAS